MIYRPGVAKILCGKPNDSAGSCAYPHCPREGVMKNCMWEGRETGYYMEKTQFTQGYNEIILQTSPWPSNIVEASFGDPLLPEPHLVFDPNNWVNPFRWKTSPKWRLNSLT